VNGPEIHDAVDRVGSVAVPLRPPTALGVTQGGVGGVLEEEMNMVNSRGGGG
jgi:hypothetical protein